MVNLTLHEITCVVVYSPDDSDPTQSVSASAILLSPSHVLATGCLLCNSHMENTNLQGTFKVLCSQSNSACEWEAELVTSWQCRKLAQDIEPFFASSDLSTGNVKDQDIELDKSLLSMFLLLHFKRPMAEEHQTLLRYDRISSLSRPDGIMVCSTPFGSTHFSSLCNSWSSGIISKCINEASGLFLTDVSCVPGSQGGLVFDQRNMLPAAVIIYPVIWRSDECSGLSIISSLQVILESLHEHTTKENIVISEDSLIKMLNNISNIIIANASREVGESPEDRLVRVTVGNSWGSGIILSGKYVLTCAHVVQGQHSGLIFVVRHSNPKRCKVIYQSMSLDKLDVAILELQDEIPGIGLLPKPSSVMAGQPVTAQGFGIFERGGISITTSGIISTVMQHGSSSYYVLTTCKVSSGASGGMILDQNMVPLGLIIANTYDATNKITYPHISMALCIDILYDCIKNLCLESSVTGFMELENRLKDHVGFSMQSKL